MNNWQPPSKDNASQNEVSSPMENPFWYGIRRVVDSICDDWLISLLFLLCVIFGGAAFYLGINGKSYSDFFDIVKILIGAFVGAMAERGRGGNRKKK